MIWWDIRPHWKYPTLEFRCCDVPMRVDETICIAALCQALVAKLYRLHKRNLSFRLHRRSLIMENKWRAARWGVSGKLIDLGKMRERPTPSSSWSEILEFVDDVVDDLGSRKELEYLRTDPAATGPARTASSRSSHESGGDTKAVVDLIIEETKQGLPCP